MSIEDLALQHVARVRLDEGFTSATGGIIRILAPAGFGKTKLVERWVADDQRAVIWLDLTPLHNDRGVLMDDLARGFEAAGVVACAADHNNAGSLVSSTTTPFTVVLDDLERLDSEESATLIAEVARDLPVTSTLVLAGRFHVRDEAIARLRLNPGVIDLGPDELAFNLDETAQLFDLIGLPTDAATVHELSAMFEGWPAGLRLAQHSRGVEGQFVEVPDTRTRHVVEYLDHEWLGVLDPDDEALLIGASCLGRFTAEMCEEVLDQPRCGERLRRMRGLVVPLDAHDEWFRVHHLLASLLPRRLRDRTRVSMIHGRASRWWEDLGEIDRAIEHAGRGGDDERGAQLIVDHVGEHLATGRWCAVQRWIDRLPAGRLGSDPRLQTAAAMLCVHVGDGAGALLFARQLDVELAGADECDETALRRDVLRALVDTSAPSELIALAERARRHLTGPWRIFANWALGANLVRIGDLESSRAAFETGAFEARLTGCHFAESVLLASVAAVADLEVGIDAVAVSTRQAEGLLPRDRTAWPPSVHLVTVMSALVEARAGQRVDAPTALERARLQLDGYVGVAPGLNLLAHLAMSRAWLLAGDRNAAVAHLRHVEHHLALGNDRPEVLDVRVRELRTSADAAVARSMSQAGTLTDAEMRVMEFLPTNLSLADIARQLFVSRNTVKSHVAAIHRKLATTTRTQTVERARSVGLLVSAFDHQAVR